MIHKAHIENKTITNLSSRSLKNGS